MAILWDVAPCSLVEVYRRFRGACCLHHQGDKCNVTTVEASLGQSVDYRTNLKSSTKNIYKKHSKAKKKEKKTT
jgi:hypothetical protein